MEKKKVVKLAMIAIALTAGSNTTSTTQVVA
jgi:hypothetical protein